jgi:hypothetical protein
MKARGADTDPVYAYLKRLADGESAGLGRLLYVAARAGDVCISPACSRLNASTRPACLEGAARGLGAGEILARAWRRAPAGRGPTCRRADAAAPPALAGVVLDPATATWRAKRGGDAVTEGVVAFRSGA